MKAFDMEQSAWARFSSEERRKMEEYSTAYRHFLDTARTERLAAKEIIRQAEDAGFKSLSSYTSLKAGDKVYWNQKGKSVILAVIGSEPLEQGMKIVGSHIDCPRLDLKAMPVTEKNKIVYKIQILTSKEKLPANSRLLKGYKNVECVKGRNFYKYYYGKSTRFNEISRLRKRVIKDFKDAYIVVFKNGKEVKQ